MARAMARSKKRLWGFDDGERAILVAATTAIPGLRGVVERAGQRADLQGLWVVEASVDELDEMYSLVEALMDGTRSRRRLEQLEGMRATLCTSIDGFSALDTPRGAAGVAGADSGTAGWAYAAAVVATAIANIDLIRRFMALSFWPLAALRWQQANFRTGRA